MNQGLSSTVENGVQSLSLSIGSMCCFVGAYGSSIGQVPCKCMLQYCTILARAFLHASDSVCSAVLCFSHAEYSTVTLSMSL